MEKKKILVVLKYLFKTMCIGTILLLAGIGGTTLLKTEGFDNIFFFFWIALSIIVTLLQLLLSNWIESKEK